MPGRHASIPVGFDGNELTSHGTAEFPCGCYYCDPLVHETPWHWHEELEFVYVTVGTLMSLAGARRHILGEGDALFINSGVPHAEQPVQGSHAMEGDLVCHPRLLYGDRGSALWTRYFSRLSRADSVRSCVFRHDGEPWEREASALVGRAWVAMAAGEELFELTVRESLARVALIALQNGPDAAETAPADARERTFDRIKDMVEFVEGHFDEQLSIDQIARAGQVSAREAQRAFKEVLGESPVDYLNEHRLLIAARRLLVSGEPVGTIARMCGFPNQSYFNRRFRERYGCTPREYRAMA